MYTFRGIRTLQKGDNRSRDPHVPFSLPCRHTWRIQFGLGTPQRVISLIEYGKALESTGAGPHGGDFRNTGARYGGG